MNSAEVIVQKFGGQSALAKLLETRQSTVQYWTKKGRIPAKWQPILLKLANDRLISLNPSDFMKDYQEDKKNNETIEAVYPGVLSLGESNVDCYVLNTGDRVLSLSGTVKAIADVDSGKLSNYTKISALKPYINNDEIIEGTIEFVIPGNPNLGKGIRAEDFLDICKAYVTAFFNNTLTTERQKEIAMKCGVLLSACSKTGLIALIDEATGYQYIRENDALQFKMKLFIAEEMRPWEKTFPDELWAEFGRLTNWEGPLHLRPKWWGKLVNELVYGYLDADVYNWLKSNLPKPKHGMNYHQWLTSQYGLKKLIEHIWMLVGMAKSCFTMHELREKMAIQYGHQQVQLNLFIPMPTRK